MALILTVLAVFIILLASELLSRTRGLHSELSRKFVHLSVGSFVAFWPFFLTWNEIRLLSVAFIVVVALSRWLNLFRAIHSVDRPTWGEIYFAAVVGLITFVTHSKGIYAAALLQMSLADGLAAVMGVQFGMRHNYKIFGHTKTILGTATFLAVSLGLLVGFSTWSISISPPTIILLSVGATLIENVAIAGLDNIFVPLLIALVLTKIT